MDAYPQTDVTAFFSSTTLLNTKLSRPGVACRLVNRSRLTDALAGEGLRPFSLVCAPAGFGKTTALVSALESLAWPVAWLALDEMDNDANRFLHYLIAAVQTVAPAFGASACRALASSSPPAPRSLLPALINEVHAIDEPFVLALDDYHVIDSPEVHQLLEFLLEQQPAMLHIAMTSRCEPPLPLSRMRVRQQVAEIGEAELRFTAEERAQFFCHSAGLSLSEQELAVLGQRTEGWAAGMQLVALSLKEEGDRTAFIRGFAGDNRYIADYLTEEVLRRQREEVRTFLLATSILERLCGPLCDAVTGREGSGALLAQLERSDMFLIPLDQRRHWYRYHHLFAELLQQQLRQQQDRGGTTIAELHRRASRWFMAADAVEEAMHHALMAQDLELTLMLLERYAQPLFMRGQCGLLVQWFGRVPPQALSGRPSLLLKYIWSRYVGFGVLDEALIEALAVVLEQGGLSVEEQAEVEADLQLIQAFRALQQRHWQQAVELSRSLLATLAANGDYCTSPIHLNLAVGLYGMGDIDEAQRVFQQARLLASASQTLVCLTGTIGGIACCHLKAGELAQAVEVIEQAFVMLKRNGWLEQMADIAWLHMALGDIAYEQNWLEAAQAWLDKAAMQALADRTETLAALVAIRQARLHRLRGEVAAQAEALQRYRGYDTKPALLPLMAEPELDYLTLCLRRGEMAPLLAWQQQRSIRPGAEIPAGFEDEHCLQARLLLLQGDSAGAEEITFHLRTAARQRGCHGEWLLFSVVHALALQAQGERERALAVIREVLPLAERQCFVRTFIDEGGAMARLLTPLAQEPACRDYATRLLQQFDEAAAEAVVKAESPAAEALLSRAEVRTLELLERGLSNREIAEQAFISINTVKTHLKNIYAKLDVDNRVQAIARFRQLRAC